MNKAPGGVVTGKIVTREAFTLFGDLSPILLACLVVPFSIAVVSPDDVLKQYGTGRAVVVLVSTLLPWIDVSIHANSTQWPEVAALAHSVNLLSIMILTVFFLIKTQVQYPRILNAQRQGNTLTRKHLLFTIIGGPGLVVLYFMYGLGMPGDPGIAKGLTTESRWGFAFVNACVSLMVSLTVGGWPAMLRLLFDLYVGKPAR